MLIDLNSLRQFQDGYFVHFFADEKLPSLPKHLVFVLDISGSMEGEKLQQMKDAMIAILDDLGGNDRFNIITFSDEAREWKPEEDKNSMYNHVQSFMTRTIFNTFSFSLACVANAGRARLLLV